MKKKFKTSTIILIIICFVGLMLLSYPKIADFWNNRFVTKTINDYSKAVENITEDQYKKVWNTAIKYNEDLLDRGDCFSLTDDLRKRYEECLNVDGTGVMGYIEIDKIGVSLPLYHGTGDDILSFATGHIDWSSLPTGGENTHCVLSGHRGLPNAKLFTDLDALREGDTFRLNVLNEVLTYEADQIRTVEPTELSELIISSGKDYCTLVTCTPYGINTHRLLVRGHRIPTEKYYHIISEAVLIDPLIVAPVVAFPFLFILLMVVLLKKPQKKKDIRQLVRQEIDKENNNENI